MYFLLDDTIRFTYPANTLLAHGSRRLSDAQVLTTALVATRFFGGNLVVAKILYGAALGAEPAG